MAEAAGPASDGDTLTDPGRDGNPASREARPGRGPLRNAARAAAAVLLLQGVLLAAWWAHGQWRLGRVVLTNDGDPLTVEVLHESRDDVIAGPVAVLDRTTLALPDGDYRLRVSGSGRPGRIVRIAVNRGELLTHPLTLDDSRLLGQAPALPTGLGTRPRPAPTPIPATAGHLALEMTPGKWDFIEWSDTQLSRRDGASGQVLWDALAPAKPGEPPRKLNPWLVWFARSFGESRLIVPSADLDGDGVRDLVWTFPQKASFLALSGKDGSILWTYIPELDGPGSPRPESPTIPGPFEPVERRAQILPQPALLDADRDGVPDIIATLLFQELPDETSRRAPDLPNASGNQRFTTHFRRVIQAVSGRSGKALWAHAIDARFAPGVRGNWTLGADVARGRTTSFIGFLDRNSWRGLDPASGRTVVGPINLGPQMLQFVRYADLDGDGVPELIASGVGGPNATAAAQYALTALALPSGRPLWSVMLAAPFDVPFGMYGAREWPMAFDLDEKGRRALVVPDVGPLDPVHKYRGLRCLDGVTGRTLWTRPMRPDTVAVDGVFGAVEAPDLDGDGARDVVTASVFLGRHPINAYSGGPDSPERVYVDALSGKDGRPLWWWAVDKPRNGNTTVGTPLWWGRGPDGWPLLAVPINAVTGVAGSAPRAASDPHAPTVHMLEASSGREVQTIRGLVNPQVHDLDGDGLADLWGDYEQTLRAFRGEAPGRWRALGTFPPAAVSRRMDRDVLSPAADLDGDGIGDTLLVGLSAPDEMPPRATGSRTALARSGRDGRMIWKARVDIRHGWFDRDRGERYGLTPLTLPAGDLDGDGAPEILVRENSSDLPLQVARGPATLPLSVLSGRTGKTLWSAGPLLLGFVAHGYSRPTWTGAVAVEPGRPPDLIVRHASPFHGSSTAPVAGSNLQQDRLARVSGRTGQVLWDVPLVNGPSPVNQNTPPPVVRDLDGDGAADFAFVFRDPQIMANPPSVVRALSLRDGRRLWSSTFAAFEVPTTSLRPLATGQPGREELLMMIQKPGRDTWELGLLALDARTSAPSWRWNGGANLPRTGLAPSVVVARQGAGKPDIVAFCFQGEGVRRQLVLVEAGGRERIRREFPNESSAMIRAVDLDGDGDDELLIGHGNRVHACDLELHELWSRPEPHGVVLPAHQSRDRREAWVTLQPGGILDGLTGRPTWQMQRNLSWRQPDREILDPGDATRPPLIVSHFLDGATVVCEALPATDEGTLAPPVGARVPSGALREDPRWTRLLPWVLPVGHELGFRPFLVLIGLAVANVFFPMGIVWLAAGRRRWSILTLMSLPVAAAVPLAVFHTFEPLIPAQIGATPVSPRLVFALGTIVGVPFVALPVAALALLVRRRWKPLAGWSALAVAATAAIAFTWLYHDSRGMPAIEHYGRSGWPLVLVPGAFATGLLILTAWPMERVYRWMKRPRPSRPEPANP